MASAFRVLSFLGFKCGCECLRNNVAAQYIPAACERSRSIGPLLPKSGTATASSGR